MTQQSTKKEYNTFVKGIITEAGPLTFPEHASLDEENCILNRNGSRQRRLGMDFEEDFVLRNATVLNDDAVACFNWHNAANSEKNQLAVVQVGAKFMVFDAMPASISANLITTVDLSAYITGKTVVGTESGMGYFFIFSGTWVPFYLSYNSTTRTVSVNSFTIKIRDFFGLDDGLNVEDQPFSLSTAHNYNLLNQGWPTSHINTYKASAGSVYPSNSQQWFVGKDSDENFQPAQLKKMDFGTTPAPKGRFVIDAFRRSVDRDAKSGLSTPSDIETGYPSCVEFAFERLFYAGCESIFSGADATKPNYTGFVFYSRTLRSPNDFGQCYSDADPTSEMDSELVDTDGGFVRIPNCGKIHKLVNKGSSVLVFADEGIWEIRGDEGGFRGTSFQTIKLTNFGVLSSSSIVDTEEAMFYWNEGGIYILAPDEASMSMVAKNVTENSIQTLYNSWTQAAKKTAVGTFDPINRRVMWMYNDSPTYNGLLYRNSYNKELVLDLVLEAFYKHSISSYADPSPYIAGYLRTPNFVTNLAGVRSRGDSVTKYLTVQFLNQATNAASVSFGYYKNASLRDWQGIDGTGVRYVSYLITGYEIMEDTTRNKQASYLFLNFKRTELNAVLDSSGKVVPDNPSGCYVQAQWDWADHPDSGKWGQQFQGYRLNRSYVLQAGQPINYGHAVIATKSRLPGRGKALSLYFQSEDDKDFYLYGWAVRLTGDSFV